MKITIAAEPEPESREILIALLKGLNGEIVVEEPHFLRLPDFRAKISPEQASIRMLADWQTASRFREAGRIVFHDVETRRGGRTVSTTIGARRLPDGWEFEIDRFVIN